MSYDGQETFVLVPLVDEGQIEELAATLVALELGEAELLEGAIVLQYGFGYGETHTVPLEHLDEVVKLPWERWDGDGELDELRYLTADKVAAALETVRKKLRRPRGLAARIEEVTESDGDDTVLEMLRAKPSPEFDAADAATTGSRLAQVLRALRFALKRAVRREAALVLFRHELPG